MNPVEVVTVSSEARAAADDDDDDGALAPDVDAAAVDVLVEACIGLEREMQSAGVVV